MAFSLFNKKPVTQPPSPADQVPPEGSGFLKSLKRGLAKTHDILTMRIDDLILGKKEIDQAFIDDLEEILITSDLGVSTSHKLISAVQAQVKRGEADDPAVIKRYLKESVHTILQSSENSKPPHPETSPLVIMVVGVNGTGKTTTIAKLAHLYTSGNKKVLLVAADTFRAAAIEQLDVWSSRIACDIIKQEPGADPSAVIFDALKTAHKRGVDIVLIDTAGRMHTKVNLIEELKKMYRVTSRACPGAPHETLLVIDATTGQNALSQARLFGEALDVSAIALTKLDGTAKGGIIIAIADQLKIPISYIGIGEQLDDLKPFDARAFVDALFDAW